MKPAFHAVLALVFLAVLVIPPFARNLHALEDGFDPLADADKGVDVPDAPSFLPEEEIEAGTRDGLEYGESMDEDWGDQLPDEDNYDLDKITNPGPPEP